MAETKEPLSPTRQKALVLALGWSAAELMGRYRHGIHPRNPAAEKTLESRDLPRLSYGKQPLASNNALFWLVAQRLIVLADELGLDDLEDREEPDSIDSRIRRFPTEIRDYIAEPESTDALEPENLYQLLEDWTQLARLELGVRSQALREIFDFAGDLADLYWALPVPQRYELEEWADAWRKTTQYRIRGILGRLEEVKKHLPLYVGTALEDGLKAWQVVRPAWLEGEFELEQARQLAARFGEQTQVWGNILQGERGPEDYLLRRDRGLIQLSTALSFGGALLGILLGFSLGVVGVIQFVTQVVLPFVQGLFPGMLTLADLLGIPSLSEWVTIGGLAATTIGFLGSASVWLFRQLGSIYRWLLERWVPLFLEGRTVVRWEANV
jgi:hypothetical protein